MSHRVDYKPRCTPAAPEAQTNQNATTPMLSAADGEKDGTNQAVLCAERELVACTASQLPHTFKEPRHSSQAVLRMHNDSC